MNHVQELVNYNLSKTKASFIEKQCQKFRENAKEYDIITMFYFIFIRELLNPPYFSHQNTVIKSTFQKLIFFSCKTESSKETIYNMVNIKYRSFSQIDESDFYKLQNGICFILKERNFMAKKPDDIKTGEDENYQMDYQIFKLKQLFRKLKLNKFVELELERSREEFKFELTTELIFNSIQYDCFTFLLFIHSKSDG